MQPKTNRSIRLLISAMALVISVALASPAMAAKDLMGELPEGHDTVIAVDFSQIRDSPLYDQAFDTLLTQPEFSVLFNRLRDDLEIDARTDLDSLVVVSNSPPLSPSMLNRPLAAFQGAAAQGSDGTLILVRGDIEPGTIIAGIADEPDDAGSYLRQDGMDLQVLDDRTLAITLGSQEYLDEIHNLLAGERSGPGSAFVQGMAQLAPTEGVHIMIQPTIEDEAQVEEELGATPTFMAVAVEFKDEVNAGAFLELSDEAQATEMVEVVDQVRQEASGRLAMAMVMFGVHPLVNNLSVRQSERNIFIRSSMTNAEAMKLATKIPAIIRSSQELSQPIGGDDEEEEDVPSPANDGVEADFN